MQELVCLFSACADEGLMLTTTLLIDVDACDFLDLLEKLNSMEGLS